MTAVGRKLYQVTLTDDERTQLQDLVAGGKGSKERRKRAHILLLADTGRDRGGRLDTDIADALGVNVTTVERVRKRCVMAGLDAALDRKPHPKPQQLFQESICRHCSPEILPESGTMSMSRKMHAKSVHIHDTRHHLVIPYLLPQTDTVSIPTIQVGGMTEWNTRPQSTMSVPQSKSGQARP
ncbi:MAG: helix-turn-helix domain-containing protein [Aestuariivita sp.]|nr:helix-turn-helix domain-containing protein [Aestuariivita sp.]